MIVESTFCLIVKCDVEAINDRLDAIDDMRKIGGERLATMRDALKALPDLERLTNKVHQLGNVGKNHPESRAIMYENDAYSKKKVEDFILLLNGFTATAKLLADLSGKLADCASFKSRLLKSVLTISKESDTRGVAAARQGFPYLDKLLAFYHSSFDAEQAKRDGKIIPLPGLDADYDAAIAAIKQAERKLDDYLKQQGREHNCSSSVKYFGTGKNRYQLELPEARCTRLPATYELTSSRKGFKRYWTPEIKQWLADMTSAESARDQALRDTIKSLFRNFDKHYNVWHRAVQCLSILDVLLSLTSYVSNADGEMCRPELVVPDEESNKSSSNSTTPFIQIVNGRHPCLTRTFGGEFIPNDVVMGCEDADEAWQRNPLLLVTGPNMGGKSTLMRQTGLTVILAQMGCYVPAERARLSPVDRIFTRIGASDKILAGESTFFLELSETASILHHATKVCYKKKYLFIKTFFVNTIFNSCLIQKHSLVLMDELGRGTATFDGTAIAYSVVKELAQKINCRTLFSTHYHHLVEEFAAEKDKVSMGHMQSMVNDDDHSITFLYKFGEGACPKSHGFNAARLADIPDEIIQLGSQKSIEFETFTKRIQFLK